QQLLRQFADFQNALLQLKQRLAKGTPEERKRAEVLGQVFDEGKNLAINQEFLKMIELIRVLRPNTNSAKEAHLQSDNIAEKLGAILKLLRDTKVNLSED